MTLFNQGTSMFRTISLATATAALLLAGAPAQADVASPADIATFKTIEVKLWDAWSKRLKSVDAAPFYSKKPGTLHFDIAPLKFTGWTEYEVESQKALPKDGGTAKVTIGDDFTVIKGGPKLAVVAFTWTAIFYAPDGSVRSKGAGRETDVFEKEGAEWLITHQHLSVVPRGAAMQASAPAPAH
jgi:hypothetical protein